MYKFCPTCGKRNENWKYCPECGEYLGELNESTKKSPAEVQEELEIIKSIIKKFEEELKDAEADEKTLLALPKSERTTSGYQKAWNAI